MYSDFNLVQDIKNGIFISDKASAKFSNMRELMMYYHTTIRNVGLFTSVALAGISAARLFSGDSFHGFKFMYAIVIFTLALAFLLMATRMCLLLIRDLREARKYLENDQITDWLLIPYVLFGVDLLLVAVALVSIFGSVFGKK